MSPITHHWPDRQTIRIQGFDYRSAQSYFLTINVADRHCVLGNVIDGRMHLSPIGHIVADEWMATPHIRPYVTLDEWVIMPNHVHGIVVFHGDMRGMLRATHRVAPTRPRLIRDSLGSMMAQFKSITTKRIRKIGHGDFSWQRNYYERIIRDDMTLDRIRTYIRDNPVHWDHDRADDL